MHAIDTQDIHARTPWHLWLVGGLALLWYASGAITIQLAQLGRLPSLEPAEAAYYAAKPVWLVIGTALATYGAVLASLFLLLRRKAAVALFALSLLMILIANVVELANGTSRAYANSAAATVTMSIAVVAVLMLVYALAMQRRGVLR